MARHALKPKKRRKRRASVESVQFVEAAQLRGPARFTGARFFSGVGDVVMIDAARQALRTGYQIETATLDYQLVPAFVILATWALFYEGVELVDDYERLLEAHREAITEGSLCAHPDLFMASCITLLAKREQHPCRESFEAIGFPGLFNELVLVEE